MRKRLNVRLLFILFFAVVIVSVCVHLAHAHQMRRYAQNLFDRAEQAAAEGQYDRATTFLSRRLVFVPDDPDNLIQYAATLERHATSTRVRARALSAYQDALARVPSRKDLREKIAFLAFDLGQYAEVRNQLTVLLDAAPDRGDLVVLLARCDEVDGAPARAAKSYERAVSLMPGRVDLFVKLAELYRDRLDQPELSVDVMDRLVLANPNDFKAYLARARFRMAAGAPDEASNDLAEAIAAAPDDVEVLLARADIAYQLGRVEEARNTLRDGLERHPDHAEIYLRLAELESHSGREKESIRRLRQGIDRLPDHPNLLKSLGDMLIDAGQLVEASEIITRLQGPGKSMHAAGYLEGRVLMHQGHWLEASHMLEQACSVSRDDAPLAAQVYLALGHTYGKLGYSDRQIQSFRQALTLDSTSLVARANLGDALLNAGRVEEAINHHRRVVRFPEAPRDSRANLARALIRLNVYLPKQRREWKEIDGLLDDLDRDKTRFVVAALLRAESLKARNQFDDARKLLESVGGDHDSDPDLGLALADLAAGRSEFDEAVRLLNNSWGKTKRRLEERVSRLDAWAQRGSREASRSLQELANGLDHLTEQDQVALIRHLATQYRQVSKTEAWLDLCRKLAAKPLNDLAAAQQFLELALLIGDQELMALIVKRLRSFEGEGGTTWRYGAAAVLIARARNGDQKALAPARGWLAIAIKARTDWPRPVLLLAQIEEMEGRPEHAVDLYLRAFELGERQPSVTIRLVRMLVERGRHTDADRVVRQYQQQAELGRDFARQAAEIAVQSGNFERAQELASELVPEGSADFRDQLWLSQLLAGMSKRHEAERALYRATELAPRVPDTWVALAGFLAQIGQTDRAKDVMNILPDKLAPDQLSLTRARCWAALYRTDKADEEYRIALAERPHDGRVLMAAAGFYLRLAEVSEAEPLLRKLLGAGVLVPEEDLPAIRRQLALVLSVSGEEPKVNEALALLDQNPHSRTEVQADQCIRALVMAALPSQRKNTLVKLDGPKDWRLLTPDERFRLARLYDAENDWPRVRVLMDDLLSLDGYNPTYLAFLIERLLQQDEASEAKPWLIRLDKAAPGSPRTKDLQAKVRALGGG